MKDYEYPTFDVITLEWVVQNGGTDKQINLVQKYFPDNKPNPFQLFHKLIENQEFDSIRWFLSRVPCRSSVVRLDKIETEKDVAIILGGLVVTNNNNLIIDKPVLIGQFLHVPDTLTIKDTGVLIVGEYVSARNFLMNPDGYFDGTVSIYRK